MVTTPNHGFQLCNEWAESKHPKNAIAEVKYDGMMVLVEQGRLYNRNLRDETFRFPEIQVHKDLVIVGEIVILVNGISQFHLLARRMVDNPKEIRLRSRLYPATLIAFDVLEVNGQNFADDPLSKRRQVLEGLEHTKGLNGACLVSGYWGCPAADVPGLLQLMRDQMAEGIIVKDLDAPYKPSRGDAWLKLKAWAEKDFDILSHEITENGGFVVWVENKGYRQRVVVNNPSLAQDIATSHTKKLTIRYLQEEPTGALRQAHVHGVPWH